MHVNANDDVFRVWLFVVRRMVSECLYIYNACDVRVQACVTRVSGRERRLDERVLACGVGIMYTCGDMCTMSV